MNTLKTSRSFKKLSVLATFAVLALAPVAFGAKGGGGGGGGGSTQAAPPPEPNPVDKILTLYDTNHNGRLERDEIMNMAKLDQTTAQEAKKYDADHSGSLDLSEIEKWKLIAKPAAKSGGGGRGGGGG